MIELLVLALFVVLALLIPSLFSLQVETFGLITLRMLAVPFHIVLAGTIFFGIGFLAPDRPLTSLAAEPPPGAQKESFESSFQRTLETAEQRIIAGEATSAQETPTAKLLVLSGWWSRGIHKAAKLGDVEAVRRFLDEGNDANQVNDNGFTPLPLAALNCRAPVTEFLLSRGGDTARRTVIGASPLEFAAGKNCVEVARILLDGGADVNARNSQGFTPIAKAAISGHWQVSQMLIEHGANVDLPDVRGWTPLMYAATHGHKKVARILLEAGADIHLKDDFGQSALHHASSRSYIKLKDGTHAYISPPEDNAELILLLKGAEVSIAGLGDDAVSALETPTAKLRVLFSSLEADDISEIRELINNGADVNVKNEHGLTPLFRAAQNGHTEIVNVLLAAKADVNAADETGGVTPLFIAAQFGHTKIVKALLAAKADANAAYKDGRSPLWMAAQFGHTEIVNVLLAAKADVNASRKTDSATPLYMAAENGHTKIVKALLAAKADVNAADETGGATPLFIAAQFGHTEIVRALLRAHADVDSATKNGATPLLVAIDNGHAEVVKALLEAKANVHAKASVNGKDYTPLGVARINGQHDILKLLQDHDGR